MFLVFPGFVFLLSLAGPIAIYMILIPLIILIVLVTAINLLQNRKPKLLPDSLKTWSFLPEPLRSLEPLDSLVVRSIAWRGRREREEKSKDNLGFQTDITITA